MDKNILELGCGDGQDSRVLQQYAGSLISADLSPEMNNHPLKVKLNHGNPLPFRDHSFDVVVASLCFHYFHWQQTLEIFSEVARILRANSILICRLNSEQDTNYGAGSSEAIEPGLFRVDGQLKRFFSERDIEKVLDKKFWIADLKHKVIDRYQMPKAIYEFHASNI